MSRNITLDEFKADRADVTSREGRVSRNKKFLLRSDCESVTSREGRVSRNGEKKPGVPEEKGHVPRGTCE